MVKTDLMDEMLKPSRVTLLTYIGLHSSIHPHQIYRGDRGECLDDQIERFGPCQVKTFEK